MPDTTTGEMPIIEPNPSGKMPETGMRALTDRVRQQELLAELGVTALKGASLDQLLAEPHA